MIEQNREKLLYRILSGKEHLLLRDNGSKSFYWLTNPTPEDKLISIDIYDEVYSEAILEGLYTEEESVKELRNRGLWTKKEEEELEIAIKNIDKLKMGLYKSFKKREKEAARFGLKQTREEITRLTTKKYKLFDKTAEYVANLSKIKFLIGKSLLKEDGDRVWNNNSFWRDTSTLLDEAYFHYITNRITESQIRDLSRNDPWRPIWICKNIENSVFGLPACKLTDDQKAIIAWSKLYDSCYEDQERPSDEVINEDDMFDGWLITKRKEREKETKKSKAETILTNEKIANSSEVFVMGAEPGEETSSFTQEDLEEIEDLNSDYSAGIKKERMKVLFERGQVTEASMPDTSRHIQSEFNRMMTAKNASK